MAAHNDLGTWGEELAAVYLRSKGFVILESDWHSGHRDIDLIAIEGDTLVFVEVKTRRNRNYGAPEESIDYEKLRHLRASMNQYVKSRHVDRKVRLDVVTIVGTPDSASPEINHIKDFPMY